MPLVLLCKAVEFEERFLRTRTPRAWIIRFILGRCEVGVWDCVPGGCGLRMGLRGGGGKGVSHNNQSP